VERWSTSRPEKPVTPAFSILHPIVVSKLRDAGKQALRRENESSAACEIDRSGSAPPEPLPA
jgi:hypothetical protein